MKAVYIALCGPSGCGKGMFGTFLLDTYPTRFVFSVSATTRTKRSNEIDGTHYYFWTIPRFKQGIDNDEFVEWEEVYTNGYYGTLRSELEKHRAGGKVVIFDLDVEGAEKLKDKLGDDLLTVFIEPPSIEVLKERILQREPVPPPNFEERLKKAAYEISRKHLFDKIVVNDDREMALADFVEILDDCLPEPLIIKREN